MSTAAPVDLINRTTTSSQILEEATDKYYQLMDAAGLNVKKRNVNGPAHTQWFLTNMPSGISSLSAKESIGLLILSDCRHRSKERLRAVHTGALQSPGYSLTRRRKVMWSGYRLKL